jgi:hypothetical protein
MPTAASYIRDLQARGRYHFTTDPAALLVCFQRCMLEGGHRVTRAQFEANLHGKRDSFRRRVGLRSRDGRRARARGCRSARRSLEGQLRIPGDPVPVEHGSAHVV